MDDDDFDYPDEVYEKQRHGQAASGVKRQTTITVQNQPHDEEVLLSESESLNSPHGAPFHADRMEPSAASQLDNSADDYSLGSRSDLSPQSHREEAQSYQASPSGPPPAAGAAAHRSFADVSGAYNPRDYEKLNVTEDVQDLFKYITRYKPQQIELATPLKPFIPDFIPAYGGIDEFIKVPRPDGRPDFLGLKVLDEPALVQSDPTLLNLQLKKLSKEAPGVRLEVVGRIEHTDRERSARLASWISSMLDLHRSKPPAAVSYSRPMPDLEVLMQEWPTEMEDALRSCSLPSADLDMDLESYSRLVCALLDVPVYDNVLESLHVLFSLFLEFKANPWFNQAAAGGSSSGPSRPLSGPPLGLAA
eukprot:gene5005-5245_t